MNSPIRVLIADDQRVVREGLAMVLGLLPGVEVVGSASDGHEAVAMAGDLHPDVVLMDLRMPRCDGVEATRLLREREPGTKVVVLTTYADDRSVLDALRAGARGYLTKDAGGADIRQALQHVLDDHAVIDPAVQHHLVDAIATAHPPGPPARLPEGLTPREAEVLTLIASGLSNTEIAEHLFVSEGTVKSHINHLFAKDRRPRPRPGGRLRLPTRTRLNAEYRVWGKGRGALGRRVPVHVVATSGVGYRLQRVKRPHALPGSTTQAVWATYR